MAHQYPNKSVPSEVGKGGEVGERGGREKRKRGKKSQPSFDLP